ncbi:MAG: D-sedoheptulose 7-phosphate isomerase [Ignavibacterium sp.]|nr:D-sedoheptulose 7-phosphate isomerase [Ignavibacterium sp.]MCX7611137.1 D-sedoheptulose 7-phosphate isomerase [Ignavibacterium sp.]MDW8375998.1 D-sedoheptulose 7-phosphate isomerase [Ignavibacteriales bacterium]
MPFDVKEFFLSSLEESYLMKLKMKENLYDDVKSAIDMIVECFKEGNKLLICGNGGSAADSQHIATEFVIRLSHHLQRPALPAFAITTDSSNLTAGGNDIGFENVFARNVEGLGKKGDILLVISTSGNSPNLIKAVEMAKIKDMKVIGFLGGSGGKLKEMVDLPIIIPSNSTQRIQEGHITIAHIICESVEHILFS